MAIVICQKNASIEQYSLHFYGMIVGLENKRLILKTIYHLISKDTDNISKQPIYNKTYHYCIL